MGQWKAGRADAVKALPCQSPGCVAHGTIHEFALYPLGVLIAPLVALLDVVVGLSGAVRKPRRHAVHTRHSVRSLFQNCLRSVCPPFTQNEGAVGSHCALCTTKLLVTARPEECDPEFCEACLVRWETVQHLPYLPNACVRCYRVYPQATLSPFDFANLTFVFIVRSRMEGDAGAAPPCPWVG